MKSSKQTGDSEARVGAARQTPPEGAGAPPPAAGDDHPPATDKKIQRRATELRRSVSYLDKCQSELSLVEQHNAQQFGAPGVADRRQLHAKARARVSFAEQRVLFAAVAFVHAGGIQ